MQSLRSRWTADPYDVRAATLLASELQISPVTASVLTRRGLGDPKDARRFLAAEERHDPQALPGAAQAARRLLHHVERGSRIVVYGDYDVDGVCSTAMLVRALRALGARPSWDLPSRFGEGYGLSSAAVERLAAAGAELLVTVDCGIAAPDEVAAAREAGMEVIVTDHHRAGERLPDCTVVHPALGDYGSPELCASGVVLKLCEGLFELAGRDPSSAEQDLDLAALATVCDLVPLRGENRRIVRAGLGALARTEKLGLRALMRVASLDLADLTERSLAFGLGPRLNAAGRMRRADAALELLLTEDEQRAEEVARELDLLNRDRRESETRILFAADAACADQAAAAAMVVAGEGWHPGVVGIVASRLVERWHRPCVVIALEGDAGRGSGRSIGPYDLHAGLSACASHLRRFGGHRAAAGVEIERERVDPFRRALARHASGELAPDDLLPVERVDAVVPGTALGLDLAEELERLRPFGPGNPEPTLLVPAARIDGATGMGSERQHARCTVVTGAARSLAVAFGTTARSLGADGAPCHVAVRLERNRWNGVVEPRAVLKAVCPSRPGEVRELGADEPFWARLERGLQGDPFPAAAGLAGDVRDRRGEGFAGVAGDLLTSGEAVLVVVADVARRLDSLSALVAGVCPGGMDVVSWDTLASDAELVRPFDHLVALDPPPLGVGGLGVGGHDRAVHLAWGRSEVEFSLAMWSRELELRPALVEVWRALRELPDEDAVSLERALRGSGRYPRTPIACARLLRVLSELGLVECLSAAQGGPGCRVVTGVRADLNGAPTHQAARERLEEIRAALDEELERFVRPPEAARALA